MKINGRRASVLVAIFLTGTVLVPLGTTTASAAVAPAAPAVFPTAIAGGAALT